MRHYTQAASFRCNLSLQAPAEITDRPGRPVIQLRHTAATEIRRRFGVESARTILGHSDIATSEIYAERDHEMASRIAAEVG